MYVNPNKKRLPIGKRKFVGGAMAAVGMVTSIIGKAQEKKAQERQLADQKANARLNILTQDRQAEAGITAEQDAIYGLGNPDADLYANGGSLRFATPKKTRGVGNFKLSGLNYNSFNENTSNRAIESSSQGVNSPNQNIPSQTGYMATGGQMKGLAKGTDVADGNTHESKDIDGQYGITLNDGRKDVAEIEDKEVVKEDVVFSDRLKFKGKQTYADKAKSLATKRGKLEKTLDNVSDRRKRNSLERQISILDNQENTLYVDQENSKLQQGYKDLGKEAPTEEALQEVGNQMQPTNLPLSGEAPQFADGGGFWDSKSEGFNFDKAMGYAENLVPMIDNVANAFRKTPKLTTPLVAPMERLNTEVNINPQIASVRKAVGAATRNVLDNSNSAQVARNAITNAKLKGSTMEGEIRATRDNTVRGIENQNVSMANQKAMSDTNVLNQHNMAQYQRSVGIGDRQSGNIANLVDDMKGLINKRDIQKNFDESTFNSIRSDKTGTTLRNYLNNPYFMTELNNKPELKARLEAIAKEQDPQFWNNLFGNKKVSSLDITASPMQNLGQYNIGSATSANPSTTTGNSFGNLNFVKPRFKI